MIKDIYDALCRAIKAKFPDLQIFEPCVTQGLEKGDFIVYLEKVNSSPVPANLQKYTMTFVVEKHDDISNMYESIYGIEQAATLIQIDDLIKIQGHVLSSEIVDETLKTKISYTFYGKAQEYKNFMEDLIYEQREV